MTASDSSEPARGGTKARLPFQGPVLEATLFRARLDSLSQLRRTRRRASVLLLSSDAAAGVFAATAIQVLNNGSTDIAPAVTTLAAFFPLYFLAALQTGAHNIRLVSRLEESIWRAAAALVLTSAIFFFGLFALKAGGEVSRLQVGQTLLLVLLLGGLGRYVIDRVYLKSAAGNLFANLHIYDDVPVSAGPDRVSAADVGLVGELGLPEMVSGLEALVAPGLDRLIIHCSPARRRIWSQALACVNISSEIVVPELTKLSPIDIRLRAGEVSVVLANGPLRWHQRATKLLFDRSVAALSLIVALPLMALIALAIKLDSPGPVLFRQERIGLGNRRFQILKFRTMYLEKQDLKASRLTQRNDPRVTRLGAFLRRSSLDEIPQILNVLMGHMSLVGPRPHAAEALAGSSLYWEINEAYWFRHSHRPGLTGLAQIRGYRGNTFHEDDLRNRLNADLEYIATWSLLGDIRIIFRTLAVLFHKNAF